MQWKPKPLSDRAFYVLFSPIIIPGVLVLLALTPFVWATRRVNNFLLDRFGAGLEYHPWFAWRPVRSYRSNTWMWLETVDRRRACGGWSCFYRPATKQ
jgi:hypothetical protein